jgi:hypothetical protein
LFRLDVRRLADVGWVNPDEQAVIEDACLMMGRLRRF